MMKNNAIMKIFDFKNDNLWWSLRTIIHTGKNAILWVELMIFNKSITSACELVLFPAYTCTLIIGANTANAQDN